VYSAAGIGLEGELRAFGPVAARASMAATLPLDRPSYLLGDSQAFTVPALAVSAAVGAGVHFP
jgi:hypothetical protein